MIPILFETGETNFNTNGICRLYDTITAEVVEERNGIYELDFTYPTTGANFDAIKCGRIVGVFHDDTEDIQPFDIVSYEKPINGVVSFHCVHISYRLTGAVCEQTDVNTLADALDALTHTTPATPFSFEADFVAGAYAAAFDGVPRSVRQLLGGVRGSILDAYGGEYEFNGFRVILHKKRGQILDFSVRYGVNMIDYNESVDYADTYTVAIPYWKGDDGNGGETVVKGNPVYSGLLPYNGIEKCVPLDFSEKYENEPTAAQLEALAESTMISKRANMPSQNIKVDFVRLSDFAEYADIAPLLNCKLCDEIEVIFPDYGTSGYFKIVRTVYNVLAERFDEMELGNLAATLGEALGVEGETTGQTGGGGSSLVRYGECTNTAGTVAKTVNVSPDLGTLEAGVLIYVKFSNYNTATNPTLNVNGTGAKPIKRYGATSAGTSAASSWNAGGIVALMYDGSYWQIVGFLNTTYSAMTQAEMQAGTSTTARLITPARLKAGILHWATPANIGAMSSTALITGTYVYNGTATTSFSFTDANISGKSFIICGTQDSGNPPLRASISGTTITVYVGTAVSLMRVNYICF